MRHLGGLLAELSLTLLAMLAFLCMPAYAEKRVALVIGNSSYSHIGRLPNPEKDARLMASTLRDLRFTLVGGGPQIDLDKANIDRLVQDFGHDLEDADVAVFYFAGHGIQVDGINYLIPVDANPTKKADLDFQMLNAAFVVGQMTGGGAKLSLVLLDACRNNPLASRGLRDASPGLAQMKAPENTLISFATQPGNVAQDGFDGNSPYTKALAAAILRKPALGLFDTFNGVGLSVLKVTRGEQQPWMSNSPIDHSFYFTEPPTPTLPDDDIAWNSLIGTTDIAALRRFVSTYPGSAHRGEATAQIAILESQAAEARQKVGEERKKLAARQKTDAERKSVIECDRLASSPYDTSLPLGRPGVPFNQIDLSRAVPVCQSALDAGPNDPHIAFQLGRALEKKGGAAAMKVAARLYKLAADQRLAVAQNKLGVFFSKGAGGLPLDDREAARLFNLAADQGLAVAQLNLGGFYAEGRGGLPHNDREAARLYKLAADQGNPDAQAKLGIFYEFGRGGLPHNDREAARLFKLAADQGDAFAQIELGVFYEDGRGGLPKDHSQAARLSRQGFETLENHHMDNDELAKPLPTDAGGLSHGPGSVSPKRNQD